MNKVQTESGVKQIVMVHEQKFYVPETFTRTELRDEMLEAGVKNIYSAIDGDIFLANTLKPTDAIPLAPDRDSSHRLTVESAETKGLVGVAQW